MLFFGKVFKGISRKYKNFTREHGQTITQVPKNISRNYEAELKHYNNGAYSRQKNFVERSCCQIRGM